MNKSESIINLIQATIKVMAEVKGIDKAMTIGSGSNSYKGVSDQDVKKTVGDAMERNGLAMFPIGIDETTTVESWDELDPYSKVAGGTKRKQTVFTKVKTTYLLTHESGEYIEICGFGHGVDSQDKSAGKATTYALKYAMLYTFLIPTGKIDDADNTHSEDIKTPAKQSPKPIQLSKEEEKLLVQAIATLETVETVEQVKAVWVNTPELQTNQLFINAVTTAKKRLI